MKRIIGLAMAMAAATLSPTVQSQEHAGVLTGAFATDVALAPSGDVYFVGPDNRIHKLLDPANLDGGTTSVDLLPPPGGSGTAEIQAIAADASGVYASGTFIGTIDFDPGPGVHAETTVPGDFYGFIFKLDGALQYAWHKELVPESGGATVVTNAFDIEVRGGDVLIGGNFGADTTVDFNYGGPGGGEDLEATFYDGYVLKLDVNGTFQWVRGESRAQSDRVEALTIDTAGNVYATGEAGESGSRRVTFSKYNAAGTLQWEKVISSGGDGTAGGISVDADDNVYATGSFTGAMSFGFPDPTICRLLAKPSPADRDAFVVKYDSAGNCQWAGRLGGGQSDTANGLVVGGNGTVHVVGNFVGPADFDPGPATRTLASTSTDAFVARFTHSGAYAWAWGLGGTLGLGADDAFRVATNGAGALFVTGTHSSGADFDPGTGVVLENPIPGPVGSYLLRLNRLGAGPVPDGGQWVNGVPLTIGKAGALLALQWGASCGALDQDYVVYEGLLGSFASHVPLACSTGGATGATIAPAAGNRFYLVIAKTAAHEGSHGQDGTGAERSPGASTCLPQLSLGDCP